MTKRKKPKRKIKFFFFACFVIIALILIYMYFQSRVILEQTLSSIGYVKMSVSQVIIQNDTAFVKLIGPCSELNFYTTSQQGESILSGLSGQTSFRPTTHDIMKTVLNRYGIKPVIIKITKMQDNTYFAELTLQRVFNFMTIDIKPSDAIALAVRTNTPVYVNENLTIKTC